MNAGKIIMTVLGLIALFLVLSNGNAFNTALKTAGDTALKGVAVLQGRDTKKAGL
jgi:hypothetical protein